MKYYKEYIKILKEELVPAMGCTEPIAIAFAAAKAKEVLGIMPTRLEIECSGNIVKNAMCVTVPNTGGLNGIAASAIAGVVCGQVAKELQVISCVSDENIAKMIELLENNYADVKLLDSVIQLHIIVHAFSENESVSVEIKHAHTNISKIIKNNTVIFETKDEDNKYLGLYTDRSILSIEEIYEFANTIDITEVKELYDAVIKQNMLIAQEGLSGNYGVGIGKIILESDPHKSVYSKIKAYASAASEARMCGSDIAVITNSGSGNQGIASSVPVIVYARENGFSEEELYRALVVSSLVTIHQKTPIGRLSAFCGAVSASCASAAALTYLANGSIKQIKMTITNTLANISGIVCDGAKASCGAKIASSLDGAIMAHHMAMANKEYKSYTGILKEDVEENISAVGRLAKYGMYETDKEILKIMLNIK